jgi:uncharacterized protein (TIGR03083 family)
MSYDWLSEALETTWASIASTLRDRTDEAFDAPTPCPGWTVRDVVTHLSGTERWVVGAPLPSPKETRSAYVRNRLGAVNEAVVARGRTWTAATTMAEFRDATRASLAFLRALSPEAWPEEVDGPEGRRPRWRFVETRLFDAWIHLQDIRDALLEPADDHGPGEAVVLDRCEAAMAYVWATRCDAPEGALLRCNLEGRLARSVMVRVVDGRGLPVAFTDDTPDLELTTAVALLWRRCAGRISASAFLGASATDVRGSRTLALALADALAVVP